MSESAVFIVDGIEMQSEMSSQVHWKDRNFFEVIYKGKKFHGEILKRDIENRRLTLKLNHRVFDIQKKFVLDDLISKLGLDKVKVKKLKELDSPMPGRILKIQVQQGDQIQVGDPILSLEAMKMENILKSDGEGIVKRIAVKTEQIVEKGQLLIEFE